MIVYVVKCLGKYLAKTRLTNNFVENIADATLFKNYELAKINSQNFTFECEVKQCEIKEKEF